MRNSGLPWPNKTKHTHNTAKHPLVLGIAKLIQTQKLTHVLVGGCVYVCVWKYL